MISAEKTPARRKQSIIILLCVTLFAGSVAGCAVRSEPIIKDRIGNAAGMRDVFILSSDNDGEMRESFRRELQLAFSAHSVPASKEAKLIADFAISAMPAHLSLATTKPNAAQSGSDAELIIQSAPRRARLLDRCDAVRYRASIVLFDRTSGKRVHRAEGESEGCADDAAPMKELADLLVRDALLAPN